MTGYKSPEGTLIRTKLWFEDGFTQIPNTWIRDAEISFKARGILFLLLSHEAGFKVTIRSIVAAGTDGRDAVQSGVRELERRGYLRRIQPAGIARNHGITWLLQDPHRMPQTSYPQGAENPSSLGGHDGFPVTGNPSPKEEHLKKIFSSVPEVTTDARANATLWVSERCPGNWRSGVHELAASGKCAHCHDRPIQMGATA